MLPGTMGYVVIFAAGKRMRRPKATALSDATLQVEAVNEATTDSRRVMLRANVEHPVRCVPKTKVNPQSRLMRETVLDYEKRLVRH
jgi:hypothetical protein